MSRGVLQDLVAPVVGAPMAGGVSTPGLAAAVSDAGGLGMLAAGYLTPQRLADDVRRLRALTGQPFGVNLFVPRPADRSRDEAAVQTYRDRLEPEARARGVSPGTPDWADDDHWAAKVELVEQLAPAVVSCTFGVPDPATVRRWQAAGTQVHLTVTCIAEARAAAAAGPDALVLQGQEAGGHRGTHDPRAEPEPVDHLGLLELVRPVTDLPLVAAGGISGPGDVRRARQAGAVAVQIGTALLLATESGAGATYRAALRDPGLTRRVRTRAWTGRVAGALRTRFVDSHDGHAPAVFPAVDAVTRPLRQAAARAGDVHGVHVWAGPGWRAGQARGAGAIVRGLGR